MAYKGKNKNPNEQYLSATTKYIYNQNGHMCVPSSFFKNSV